MSPLVSEPQTTNLLLSAIHIDTRQQGPRADLANSAGMHRRIMSLFPDHIANAPRAQLSVLYRLETTGTTTRLLVQSKIAPNGSTLPAGYQIDRSIELRSLHEQLEPGRAMRYRILANATKKVANGTNQGKRFALSFDDTQQWWQRKATEAGFELIEPPTLHPETISGSDKNEQGNGNDRIKLRPWRIDGVATITNPNALRQAIHDGIGRGKAYGCGLLTIALLN
jgi:CRISPR system Cascade subunit CasE